MFTFLFAIVFYFSGATPNMDLPTKKVFNLGAFKTMIAAAEAEAKKRNVEATLYVVDQSGNLLFLEKADGASIKTIQIAEKKPRHFAFYPAPFKNAADS